MIKEIQKKYIDDYQSLDKEVVLQQIGEKLVPQVSNLIIDFEIDVPIQINIIDKRLYNKMHLAL